MSTYHRTKWVRSEDGWIAGVCQGLGESLDIPPGLIRLIWFLSLLVFGIGFFIYILAAFTMPVRGREYRAEEPKLLGVCYRLAKKFDMDVGLVRFLALLILFSSFGTTIIGYLILHFVVPEAPQQPLRTKDGQL